MLRNLAETVSFTRHEAVVGGTLKEEKPMSATNTVQDLNRQLAGRINAEARSNPQSPYANKFIGLADGQVVVVAVDLDDYSG